MSQRIFTILQATSAILSLLPAACGGGSSGATPSNLHSSFDAGAGQSAAGDAGGGVARMQGGKPVDASSGGSNSPIPTDAATGFLRLADWAPDALAGGFDLCIMTHGGNGQWIGPLLGSGVAFPSVGRYVAVAPGAYDMGIVPAGGTCVAPIRGTMALPMLGPDARVTVALLGDLMPSGNDQPAKQVAFADDIMGPPGQAAVRFINALPGATALIFGTGMESTLSFSPLTGSVPFGGVSSSPADGGAADPNGYLLLGPVSGTTLSAQVPMGNVDISSSTSTSFGDGGFTNGGGNPTIISSGTDSRHGCHGLMGRGQRRHRGARQGHGRGRRPVRALSGRRSAARDALGLLHAFHGERTGHPSPVMERTARRAPR